MTRRAVGTVIVGSWMVCMTWLVIRQISRPPEAFLEAAAARLAPSAAFYQILLNGVPMGNAGITLDTVFTGYRVTEVWSMDLAGPDRPIRHVYRSDAELSRSLKLQTQVVNLSEDVRFLQEGKAAGSHLHDESYLKVDAFESGAFHLLVIGAHGEGAQGFGREDLTERLVLGCPGSTLIVLR